MSFPIASGPIGARRDGARRRARERGVHTVEFALVAALFLFMVLGAIEVARLLYTWSALGAMTQRGARVAAVCTPRDPLIAQRAIFGEGGRSTLVPDIGADNIAVSYLDEDGAATDDAGGASYVRVSIVNYDYTMLIPPLIPGFDTSSLRAPAFATTRPAESFGVGGCFA